MKEITEASLGVCRDCPALSLFRDAAEEFLDLPNVVKFSVQGDDGSELRYMTPRRMVMDPDTDVILDRAIHNLAGKVDLSNPTHCANGCELLAGETEPKELLFSEISIVIQAARNRPLAIKRMNRNSI